MEFMAHMIHYSLKGAGTAEQLLCDILATASPETLEALKEKYAERKYIRQSVCQSVCLFLSLTACLSD